MGGDAIFLYDTTIEDHSPNPYSSQLLHTYLFKSSMLYLAKWMDMNIIKKIVKIKYKQIRSKL